jgi:hypothetical protein
MDGPKYSVLSRIGQSQKKKNSCVELKKKDLIEVESRIAVTRDQGRVEERGERVADGRKAQVGGTNSGVL